MIFNMVKANAEIKNLNVKVEDFAKQVEELTKTVEELKQKEAALTLSSQEWVTEKEAMVKGHEEALASLKAEHDKMISEMSINTNKEEDKAGAKAAAIVASIGIDAEAVTVTAKEMNVSDTKSRFRITQVK